MAITSAINGVIVPYRNRIAARAAARLIATDLGHRLRRFEQIEPRKELIFLASCRDCGFSCRNELFADSLVGQPGLFDARCRGSR